MACTRAKFQMLLAMWWACAYESDATASISGYISLDDGPNDARHAVWVRLYSHRLDGEQLLPISKQSLDLGKGVDPLYWTIMVRAQSVNSTLSRYIVPCPPGNYSVFAFRDPFDNGTLPASHQHGLGWHTSPRCSGGSGKICTQVVSIVDNENFVGVDVRLRSPRPFPSSGLDPTDHGALGMMRGHHVVHLKGTATERGFAHGYLLVSQILDFFEFFILEDRVQSAQLYTSQVLPKLREGMKTFKYTQEFEESAKGVLEGMQASNTSLHVSSLTRDFQLEDLYAINVYGDLDTLLDSSGNVRHGSCTQFLFSGDETLGTDMVGGTIAGRNMDGEFDFRRLTVSHLVIFAFEPSEGRRYVSIMWPGFVGTFSGFNEDGLYIMENFGCPPPAQSAVGHELSPNIDVIASLLQRGSVGVNATMETFHSAMDAYASMDGGSCSHAGILFFARPTSSEATSSLPGGFVYECDRYGGDIRLPTDPLVRPLASTNIFASNHFLRYKADPQAFQQDALKFQCNGGQPTWYSLWRYAAAQNTIEAWERAGQRVGSTQLKQLLQLVTEGITEHSIIWKPHRLEFEIAIPRLDAPWWDASYSSWVTFAFEEVFFFIRPRDWLLAPSSAQLPASRIDTTI